MRWLIRGVLTGAGLLALAACTPPPPDQTLLVDTTADTIDVNPGDGVCADSGGMCSLRAAVMEANADPDTTEVLVGGGLTYTLSLAGAGDDAGLTGDLDVSERLYVRSSGPGQATIDAGGIDRVFDIHAGDFHDFLGLVLTGGDVIGDGGAMLARQGLVVVRSTRVTANSATGDGGGIASDAAVLWIDNSTIDDNSAATGGGAIHSDSTGLTRLFQVTIDANGAGVDVTAGSLDVHSSTVTGTSAISVTAPAAAAVTNSIIAGDGTAPACVVSGTTIASGNHNVVGDGSCGLSQPGDHVGDPWLLPLADNGGPVPTRLTVVGSPARNAVPAAGPGCTAPVEPDARGEVRPVDTDCDAGAVEAQPTDAGADCVGPNLVPGANLWLCDLSGLNLSTLDLSGADLTGASLANSALVATDLGGATLALVDLSTALGPFASFDGADLTGADLTSAVMVEADFTNADLTRAVMVQADFGGAVIAGVTWSDTTCPDGTDSTANGGTCVGHL